MFPSNIRPWLKFVLFCYIHLYSSSLSSEALMKTIFMCQQNIQLYPHSSVVKCQSEFLRLPVMLSSACHGNYYVIYQTLCVQAITWFLWQQNHIRSFLPVWLCHHTNSYKAEPLRSWSHSSAVSCLARTICGFQLIVLFFGEKNITVAFQGD